MISLRQVLSNQIHPSDAPSGLRQSLERCGRGRRGRSAAEAGAASAAGADAQPADPPAHWQPAQPEAGLMQREGVQNRKRDDLNECFD